MAYREFVDSSGTGWRVWSTEPILSGHLDGSYENGWLTFERLDAGHDSSAPTVRRLAPIPREWQSAPTERLELMCRAAKEVQRRTSDPSRRSPEEDTPEDRTGRAP